MLWFPLLELAPAAFKVYTWDRVMLVAAAVSIILPFAAYRSAGSSSALERWALAVGVLAFVSHMLVVPL